MSADVKALAQRMARVFTGNQSWHYVADFKNTTIEKNGKRVPKYVDVAGPPSVEEFVAHLSGVKGLLVIPITKAGACRWGKIDIDQYPTDPVKWAKAIKLWGLPLIVELSKSGGAHLAHYSPYTESATDMRGKLADWAAAVHAPAKCELFPKQERLLDGEPGSGINLPYFGGDGKDTRNYAIDADGRRLTVAEWLDIIEHMPAKATHVPGEVNVEAAADLLSKHWTDGQRDNLNLAVGGTLLRAGVDPGIVDQILEGSSDLVADGATRKTAAQIDKMLADGRRVPGHKTLVEIIGPEDAKEFMRLCGSKPPPNPVPFEIARMPGQWATERPPEVVYAVAPLFPAKTSTVIAAEGGTGKTGFGLAAAVACATGRPFFGFEVRQGPGVYIALEESASSLWRRLHTIIAAEVRRMESEGLSPGRIAQFHADCTNNIYPVPGAGIELHLIVAERGDVRMNVEVIDRLIEKMPPDPALIVLDPIARTHGTEENANQVSTALVNAAERIAQSTGAAVVYMHHVGKVAQRERDMSMNAARGGSALIAAARSSIRMAPVTEQFDNVPAEVIAAGDLIEVVQNKLNDGKKCLPFYLRRQELTFERFEPQASTSAVRYQQLLAALFAWFMRNNRQGFSPKRAEDTDERREMFRPHDVTKRKAADLIDRAIDEGDIVESAETAPRSKSKLLIFREDFASEM